MTLETIATVVAQSILVGLLGWIAGSFVVERLFRPVPAWIGLPERALLAVVGFVALSIALMVAHILSAGAIFGTRFPVPLVAIVMIALGVRANAWPRDVPWLPVLAAAALLIAIFAGPALVGGTGVRTGDPLWHMGWTEQLLGGEPVPTGPAPPELSRNAYPWGFHAVLATMVRLVPGADPLVALEAMNLMLLLSIPLGAACLARCVRRGAGWTAAGAASLIGGFGWVLAGGPAFINAPDEARYGADLVVASPNSVYELFPPALPRELGLVMLAATGFLVVRLLESPNRSHHVALGVLVGCLGLVSVPMFVPALLWIGAVSVVTRERARRATAVVLGSAIAVFGLWLGPVAGYAGRYGGFVDISPKLGREWPLVTALGAWGLLLPLAVIGVAIAARSGERTRRPLGAMTLAVILLLVAAAARGRFGWELSGNESLLHSGRVWPVLHLLGAAFAGLALDAIIQRLRAVNIGVSVAVAVTFFGIASLSVLMAAVGLQRTIGQREAGFVYAGPSFGVRSLVDRADRVLGPDSVIEVEPGGNLGLILFQFTGARLASFDDPRLSGNDLRIRYEDLAERWDRAMATSGFTPDHLARPSAEGITGCELPVARGFHLGEDWVVVRARDC